MSGPRPALTRLTLPAIIAAGLALSACGKQKDSRVAPPTKPEQVRPAPSPDEKSGAALFQFDFNEPEIPAAPDQTLAHPGPSGPLANAAGYTFGESHKTIAINWVKAAGRDGRTALYAKSVEVGFPMTIRIWVSSRLKEDSCPYRVTWEHELSHARAFRSIYAACAVHLAGAVEHVQGDEPMVPTQDAPRLLRPDEVEDFKEETGRRLAAVIEDQSRVMTTLMEDHRRDRDSPVAYRIDVEKCPLADWQVLRDGP